MACPHPARLLPAAALLWLPLTIGCNPSAPTDPAGLVPPGEQAATPITELTVRRVDADLSTPDPGASYWRPVTPGAITLIAQPMITPRPALVTTEHLAVQAVHDGEHIAFRLSWKDSEKSEAGGLGQYSDAVALQFPFDNDTLPPVMMGGEGAPVHIFHWRAQYQRDALEGKPDMATLYPNASIDMYAMDFREAPGGSRDEREMFNPGVALGNPQSFHKTAVDEIIAEGFSTSAVQAGHGSDGLGTWKDGFWTVVLTRKMDIEGGSSLPVGGQSAVSFAVWQGGGGEVGSRKSLFMNWLPVKVSP